MERSEPSDAELIGQIAESRDPAAVEEAYRILMLRHWRVVAVFARSRLGHEGDAEDVAQEAFTKAFLSLDQLREPRRFLGWLLRIASNLVVDHLRRRRARAPVDSAPPATLEALEAGRAKSGGLEETQRRIEREEELAVVFEALSKLPELYRTALTLRYVEGLSNQEIAAVLGEPEGTIRNRLFRGLARLRRLVEDQRARRT